MGDTGGFEASALTLDMLLDVLRATAQEGLFYTADEYDRARYKKLLGLACAKYESITGLPADAIRDAFLKERGSITPKVGVDVAIPNGKGEILILQLPDGPWCLPGGWMDVGESPLEAARRETHEETGLSVTALGCIAIGSRTADSYPGAISQINICVAAEPVPDGAEITLSHEHSAYRWISHPDEVDNWRRGHKRWFPHIARAYRDGTFLPVIDE